MAFACQMHSTLQDCLYGVKPTITDPPMSKLDRYLARRDISPSAEVGDKSKNDYAGNSMDGDVQFISPLSENLIEAWQFP